MKMQMVVLSNNKGCSYCSKLLAITTNAFKALLAKKGVEFVEADLTTNKALHDSVLRKYGCAQYIAGKTKEWDEYRTRVSSWEIAKYMIMY